MIPICTSCCSQDRRRNFRNLTKHYVLSQPIWPVSSRIYVGRVWLLVIPGYVVLIRIALHRMKSMAIMDYSHAFDNPHYLLPSEIFGGIEIYYVHNIDRRQESKSVSYFVRSQIYISKETHWVLINAFDRFHTGDPRDSWFYSPWKNFSRTWSR